jgi:hypothetical protein
MVKKKPGSDLKVFISHGGSRCDECGDDLGRGAWITLADEGRALCLSCADLDHLVFLPAGDTALIRRARKHSRLFAVVLEWSRASKRYERQGLLVEEDALAQAEQDCTADAATRKARRARAAERRAELDDQYVVRFAERVRELYPGCPQGREKQIAEHACRKYSGRVGRTAAAKDLDEQVVRLAVVAHVRHTDTEYDTLLIGGWDRQQARARVDENVSAMLGEWRRSPVRDDRR